MYNQLLQPDLVLMIAEGDDTGLHEFCEVLNPVVVAEVLQGLDAKDAWHVLGACDVSRQAEILELIEPAQQIEMVNAVDRPRLSKIIEVMSPDDRVDLLGHLEEEQVEALLPLIAQAERDEIRRMLSYPEDSAGALMTTEYASLPGHITVREALEKLRQQAPDHETIYYVYIVDEQRHLQGIITLRQLILAKPLQKLADVMRRSVVSVRVDDPQSLASQLIARFDLLALPVLDEESRLVGIITHDDVLDAVQEQAEDDAYLQSAMQPLEQSYFATPIFTIAWKRGIWLALLAVFALGTAALMRSFDWVSARYDWLQWFLPLVLASGGNTGSQSATLVIRQLALANFNNADRVRVVQRELATGSILGVSLGVIVFFAVHFLFRREWDQAGVISLTIVLVVTMGSTVGSQLPMLFDRLGMDPALMSNPLIASLSDALGVAIYFTVALLLLGLMS